MGAGGISDTSHRWAKMNSLGESTAEQVIRADGWASVLFIFRVQVGLGRLSVGLKAPVDKPLKSKHHFQTKKICKCEMFYKTKTR